MNVMDLKQDVIVLALMFLRLGIPVLLLVVLTQVMRKVFPNAS